MSTNTTTPDPATNGTATAVPPVVAADLGQDLDQAVRRAVGGQIADVAKQIAKDALEEVLSEPVLRGMKDTAREALLRILDPTPPEPEPEPETVYQSSAEWVEKWLVVTYRREVTAPRSEEDFRWCPQWPEHPEAVCRTEVMWRAWEHLRQGADVQMSQFWRDHCDHHMGYLLDPKGPFIHCSVAKGHKPKLTPLPLGAVNPAAFDSHVQRTDSGLYIARTPGEVRAITEFPEFP